MRLKFFPVQGPDDGAGAGAGAGGAGAGSGAATAGATGTKPATAAGTQAGADGSGAGAGKAGATATGTGSGTGTGATATDGTGAAAAGGAAGTIGAPVWDADHWRTTWAGTDDKKKGWAERRTDLKAALDSAYAADQRIAELSTIAKTVLPKDATPEQITQYRKDNGIPDKPEAYLDALPADVKATLDATDKEILTPYLAKLQELNVPPGTAAQLIALRQAEADRWLDERAQTDLQTKQKTEDTLRADWGNNYRAEINSINNLLKGAPQEVQDMLFDARTSEGRGILAVPETLRWLAQLARTINPYSVPVGGDGGLLDQKGVEARITELEGWMGAKNGTPEHAKYWKDEKVQAEYRTLIDARDQLKKRTAA